MSEDSNAQKSKSPFDPPNKTFVCPLCGSMNLINMDLQPDFDIRKHCCYDRHSRWMNGTTLPEDCDDE